MSLGACLRPASRLRFCVACLVIVSGACMTATACSGSMSRALSHCHRHCHSGLLWMSGHVTHAATSTAPIHHTHRSTSQPGGQRATSAAHRQAPMQHMARATEGDGWAPPCMVQRLGACTCNLPPSQEMNVLGIRPTHAWAKPNLSATSQGGNMQAQQQQEARTMAGLPKHTMHCWAPPPYPQKKSGQRKALSGITSNHIAPARASAALPATPML